MDSTDRPEQKQVEECIALGNAAFSRDQLVEATTRFAQARMMLKQSGVSDSAELRHCLKTLFEIYTKRAKPEEALEIIQALRKLDDTLDHRRAYVTLLYQIAKAYEKQADRELAEEAYGEALVEATELLPRNDPLIEQLNTACIEIFKRTFKSKKLTVSDTQVRLSRLPTDQPVEDTPEPTSQLPSSEDQSLLEGAGSVSQRVYSSGTKLQMILQSNVITIGLSLVLIASLIKAALFVPAIQSAAREAAVISKIQGQQFESCDQKTTFCILDKRQCAITKPHFHAQCPYTVIENTWQDVSTMLRGYLTRDELWYEVNGTTVIDPDKTLLYRPSAPEMVIVKQMSWYADFAQKWFHDKHSYPTDVEKCKALDKGFQFLNPFTSRQDSAAIVYVKNMLGDTGWSVRPPSLHDYPHWRPGGISCICIGGTRFYIRGCDGNGSPLTASDPRRFYVIECRDGTNVTQANLLQADEGAKSSEGGRQQRVYICSHTGQEATIRSFRSFSCITAWIWAVIAALWCFSAYKLKQSSKVKGASIAVTVITYCALAGWYLLALAHD